MSAEGAALLGVIKDSDDKTLEEAQKRVEADGGRRLMTSRAARRRTPARDASATRSAMQRRALERQRSRARSGHSSRLASTPVVETSLATSGVSRHTFAVQAAKNGVRRIPSR